jgi:hypothetical protein
MFEEYLTQPISGKWELHSREDVIDILGVLREDRMNAAMRMWFRDSINGIVMVGPTVRDRWSSRETGKGRCYYLFSYQKDTFAVDCDMNDQTDRKGDNVIKYSLDDATLLIAEGMEERAEFYKYASTEMLLQGKIEGLKRSLLCQEDTIGYVTINYERITRVTKGILNNPMEHLW